uniref:LIM zinc-binding domain-containing protein n=1 Tax=Strigamia maritima TaxID=126957 RepID=T1IUK2_STRMM
MDGGTDVSSLLAWAAMTMDVKPETQKPSSSPGGGSQHECAGCKKRIGDRYMLKALDLFWHEDCLKCACCDCRLGEVGSTLFTKANLILCKRDYLRFCVGDRFYLCENKILCEYDYEERMVFANMPYNYNSIAHIKRQTQNLPPVVNDDGSSGYGSPDSLTFD